MDMKNNGLKMEVKNNDLISLESPKVVMIEEDDESKAFLSSINGGLSKKKSDKPKRKVQWMNTNGEKLAQILEFQPSDMSDSEEDDSDSCICRIM